MDNKSNKNMAVPYLSWVSGAAACLLSLAGAPCLASDADVTAAVRESRQRLGEAYEMGTHFNRPSPELSSQLATAAQRVSGSVLANAMMKNAIDRGNQLRDQAQKDVAKGAFSGGRGSLSLQGGQQSGAPARSAPVRAAKPGVVLDGSKVPREVEFPGAAQGQ